MIQDTSFYGVPFNAQQCTAIFHTESGCEMILREYSGEKFIELNNLD